MADDQHYDVVIIGTGAGGGTLGHRLATNGVKVLWLERGPFLPRERDNWQTEAVFVRAKYLAAERWYDRHGSEFQPEVNYYVGGNTKFYGAALFRLRPEDFGELRHHGGISPAWPISYDDLEPYYTEAEHLYLVHGHHGEDPTEGPASKQYAYPAVSHEPRIQQLSDDLEQARTASLPPTHWGQPPGGRARPSSTDERLHSLRPRRWLPVPGEREVGRAGHLRRPGAVRRQRHVGHRSPRAALGDRPLRTQRHGVVTVLADGSTTTTGDVVVVACGAVNSAALLLRSRGDRHPDGLANSSGVVGRHYMRHNNVALMAVSKEPNPTRFQKTLAMNDWYLGADDFEFPLGGMQMLGKSDEEEIRAQAPRWAGRVSPDLPFEVLAHHAVDFWLCGEDLPQPDNRVTVDAEGAIHLSIDEKNNVEGVNRLRHKLDGMLSHLGMEHHHLLDRSLYMHKSMPIGATAHQAGTVRFGTDPASSALDVNCRAHDVDNLYVVDTSFFPSIGAVNPSLTAIANALRVGDHITERLR